MGKSPKIHEDAYVDNAATVIGDVEIGKESSIWPMAVIRGDVNKIKIGSRTNIQDGAILHVTSDSKFVPGGYPLVIGDDITIGHGAILHACTIENTCLIGIGSTILDGVIIKPNCMIAAGSLVPPNKVLESNMLYKGSPVEPVRELTDKEKDYLIFSAKHYVETMKKYL